MNILFGFSEKSIVFTVNSDQQWPVDAGKKNMFFILGDQR